MDTRRLPHFDQFAGFTSPWDTVTMLCMAGCDDRQDEDYDGYGTHNEEFSVIS
jgi:hypothetical protein